MNPKLRNVFIVLGIVAGAISAYVLYKGRKKSEETNDGTGEASVDESKVTAEAKGNRLRIYR
jgi:hypothetical protein